MTVRNAAERSPRRLIFALADGSKRFTRGRESVSNVALLAQCGVDQDEPEVRVLGVQRDAARSPVRVVVWMREDASKGPVAGHDSNLSACHRALTGPSCWGSSGDGVTLPLDGTVRRMADSWPGCW